jgi:hypothetical protein
VPARPPARRRRLTWLAAGLAVAGPLAGALAARGWWVSPPPIPRWQGLTLRRGSVASARFGLDAQTVIYTAAWDGRPYELFQGRVGSPEARPLGLRDARIQSISSTGDMALIVGRPGLALGTLVRAPLAGGAPRELLETVREADWLPGGAELAVVRREGGRDLVEFPIGRKLHEAPSVRSLRVAPQGDRVAFFAGNELLVADRSGKATVLSRGWQFTWRLAWSPRGDQVWFSASKGDVAPSLHAVSMSGTQHVLVQGPEALDIHDVSRDGRALVTVVNSRGHLTCLAPGEKEERELGLYDFSAVEDLSADGRTVLFSEIQGGGAPNGAVYVRGTDGSPAVRLGDGSAEGLSPDGSWALVRTRRAPRLLLQPTRAGSPRELPRADLESIQEADWIDSRRIVFSGRASGRPSRVYVQDVEDGSIRPLTPEGALLPANAATPDGRYVTVYAGGGPLLSPFLYPVDGGEPRKVAHVTREDSILQWSGDGRHVFVRRGGPVRVEIQRLDTATGERKHWRTVGPSDAAGVDRVGTIVLTPDGAAHCYTYERNLMGMFIVEGLR